MLIGNLILENDVETLMNREEVRTQLEPLSESVTRDKNALSRLSEH